MVRKSTLAATLCLLLIFSMSALAQITNTPVDPNQNPPANQNQYPNQNNQNQYPNQNNQNQYPNQNQQPVFGNNQQMGNLSSGTEIKVRSDQAIDSKAAQNNQVFPGTVSQDVLDQSGNIVIPRGSQAELVVVPVNASNNGNNNNQELTLDLGAVTVNGQRFMLNSDSTSAAGSNQNGGIGANKRTGKYIGGGALAGTIVGAIAGGGKGALIGAIAGGAAGAGAQVLTRGKTLNVPAETVLDFRLNQSMQLPVAAPSNRSTLPPPQ
jgi:hypothetical protein